MSTAILAGQGQGSKSIDSSVRGPFITTRQAGRLAGVSYQTVRRLMAEGLVEGVLLESGHRRVSEPSVREYFGLVVPAGMGDDDNTAGRVVLVYARVSTQKQKAEGNLARQEERLRAYCGEKYPGQVVKVIAEVGSGLSDQRVGFLKMVEMLSAGRLSTLVCEYRDRIARFGVGVVQRLCEAHGTDFVESRTGDEVEHATTAEQEMAKDVLAILAVYSNRAMGKRGGEKVKIVPPAGFKERVCQLAGSGLSRRDIIKTIAGETWTCQNTGKQLAERSIRVVLNELRSNGAVTVPATVKTFIRSRCHVAPSKQCPTADLYSAFCEQAGEALTRDKFTEYLKQAVRGLRLENGAVTVAYGVTLKGR